MRSRRGDPARRLRVAVNRLPSRTKEAMLRGIDVNRIVVGAYVDPRSGGICPMLAAHRNGGRTDVASFARAWDEFTGAKRPRRATRREVRTLRSLLEQSLHGHSEIDDTPISELAAQIRAERRALAARRPGPVPPVVPESDDAEIRITRRGRGRGRKDLLTALEEELSREARAPLAPASR